MSSPLGSVRLRDTDLVWASPSIDQPLADLLRDCWRAGAALLPVDQRLPAPGRAALLRRARPTVVVENGAARRMRDGIPVQPGTAAVVATSGTSGHPRLVVLGRQAVTAAVMASARRLGVGPDDTWLLCLPPTHIGGLLVLFRGLLIGAPVITHDTFDVTTFAAERRARCVSLVPTMLHRLVEAGVDLERLSAILVGGDSLQPMLRQRATSCGGVLVHTYGQTQSCGGVVYDGISLDGVSAEIGQDGEVLLGGRTLMNGYRCDDAATARAFTADGRLRTGDVGSVNAAGVLHVLGRAGDVIVTGGEKVSPGDVEAVLRRHPGVVDAAVVGVDDPEWGQRVVAVVVAVTPTQPPTLSPLREWVGSALPSYAAPHDLLVVPSLPVTASGKVRREQVRDLLVARRGAVTVPTSRKPRRHASHERCQ